MNYGIVFADCSTGEFFITKFTEDSNRTFLKTIFMQIKPRELLLEKGCFSSETLKTIKNYLSNPVVNKLLSRTEFLGRDSALDLLKYKNYFENSLEKVEEYSFLPKPLEKYINDELVLSSLGALLYYFEKPANFSPPPFSNTIIL
jgi:DNA mismatch repair protein MSH6